MISHFEMMSGSIYHIQLKMKDILRSYPLSKNCGNLASGTGGSGDRERKWEGKFHRQELKMVFMQNIRLKMDQIGPRKAPKRLKIVGFFKQMRMK